MQHVSSAHAAVAFAKKNGTLKIEEKNGRLGRFVAICDEYGVIETASSREAAQSFVDSVSPAV